MLKTRPPFVELSITSNFTFLTGGSHAEEYVDRAGLLGMPAIAIADENSVAGIVRAHAAAKEIRRLAKLREGDAFIGPRRPEHIPRPPESAMIDVAPRLIPAAKLVLHDGFTAIALPKDRAAWGRLCRLLSKGKLAAEKGSCHLTFEDLLEFAEGLVLLVYPPPEALLALPGAGGWATQARELSRRFAGDVYLLLVPVYDSRDRWRFMHLSRHAKALGLRTVASAMPIMHSSARRRLTDVLTAIRQKCQVGDLGRQAQMNSERRLRSEAEMRAIFAGHERAVMRAGRLAESLTFCLSELRYEYPSEITKDETPPERLKRLAYEGLEWRYPEGATDHVKNLLSHELTLIAKLEYEPYFLTVRDIVAYARSQNILCQGRGSAANSVICYLLGITSVAPEIGTMVFERFVSEARDEPPDIDVDFEHERREEVIQHIYKRYGREKAGLCATVVHYRGKRAIREVGAAMGLSKDTISALSSQIWGWGGVEDTEDRLREIGLDPTDRVLRQTLELCHEIRGFPRHLSQHVGGFIITEGRLDELCPIENATMEDRTVIPWDKDDIDSLGILKIDVLALGMLTCIRKAFDLVKEHAGRPFTLASIPQEDPATYEMLCNADSLGVFQVESRAQMNFLPRMRPRCFYDLVIQVAIIRPGPIQGDMVHPFIRRRNGEEEVHFPSDELGQVLSKTLGVPLFQEQAMQIAITGAGFTPEEADLLRRSLATFKKHGNVSDFRNRFLRGMAQKGYKRDFAERCFSQIEGFGSYGFPESHAASFALLVYVSAYLKRHYPAVFCAALLNAQPMGFYAPSQIVRDAREHGVQILPVSINDSLWDNTIEQGDTGQMAVRLGFRQIKKLTEEDAKWIIAARGNGYRSVTDVWRRAGVLPKAIEALAEADAFASTGTSRRQAFWDARGLSGTKPLPLFAHDLEGEGANEPFVELAPMSLGEEVVEDYAALRLTLRRHPVALLRDRLTPLLPPKPVPKDMPQLPATEAEEVASDIPQTARSARIA